MGLTILVCVFVIAMLFGIPIAFALAVAAMATAFYANVSPIIIFQQMVGGMNVFSLLAIPFFIFAGELMLRGGIAMRLISFAEALVGWLRGGLGIVNVFSSMLFGGISGSAVADTSAIGSAMIPMMRKKGFDADYAVNVTVTSSVAGVVIPPSHNMILYVLAASSGLSVSALFLAGFIPGLIMCLCLAISAYWIAIKRGYPATAFVGFRQLLITTAAAIPGLFTSVVIIGGTLSGIVTVTESAAAGVVYAFIISALFYRSLSLKDFWQCVVKSIRTTAMVMLLIGSAKSFGYFLALYDVPATLLHFLLSLTENKIALLLLVNLALLILGSFMDMGPLILICTPIFLPVVENIGMDPIQFGIVLMMNLGLGLTTPPVGGCLFVGCSIGKTRMESVIKTIWPFYLAIVVALLITTFIPAVSLTLPHLFN